MIESTVKAAHEVTINTPKVPNFFSIEGRTNTVAIGDFSDEELRVVSAQWGKDLLARAAEQRKELRRP